VSGDEASVTPEKKNGVRVRVKRGPAFAPGPSVSIDAAAMEAMNGKPRGLRSLGKRATRPVF
jgi:hypothetical protein